MQHYSIQRDFFEEKKKKSNDILFSSNGSLKRIQKSAHSYKPKLNQNKKQMATGLFESITSLWQTQ